MAAAEQRIDERLRSELEKIPALAHAKTHQKVLQIFRDLPAGSVLETPSGQGALAWRLQDAGFEVTAGDLFPEQFRVPFLPCAKVDLNADFPFATESFDYICCVEGIEHLENHFHLIRECQRVLRVGGRIVISTPNIVNIASRLKFLLSGFYSLVPRPINEFSNDPVADHINPLTFYQLRYALHRYGFRLRLVTTDLHRRSGWMLVWLRPLTRWYMKRTMRKETDERQLLANEEIRAVMSSNDIFLGRTLIVVAEKLN